MVPAASALLALRSQGKPIPAAALTTAGFTISVQCWSFKEFTLWEAIEMAAAAGAGGVEVYRGQKIGGDLGDTVLDPSLSDENIAKMLEIMEPKSSVRPEERLTQLAHCMVPQLEELDQHTCHINVVRRQLIEVFINQYALDYGVQKGGLLVFNHEAFTKDLESVAAYRKGIRAASGSADAAPQALDESEEREESKWCSIS